jgi:HK97 family phage portal protein
VALISGGTIVMADTSPSYGRSTYWTPSGIGLTEQFATYAKIYRGNLWVYVVANKLSLGAARLPFKVYRREADDARVEGRDTPFGQLMRRPNPKHDPFFFWLWTATTKEVYGEALWVKIRDRAGTPVELWPLHPVNVFTRDEAGEIVYYFYGNASTEPQFAIPARDIVHFKAYNPDTTQRGLSAIEPLRQTLLNEDAARRATSSFWQRGARPAVALSHPGTLSDQAAKRLKLRWDEIAAGADRTGTTVVLEEGMKPEILSLNQEEAQYINTRKLNREEVCAAYDTPPPVVHILDHATYSNITEQMRSMYRDTMAPRLGGYESTIDQQLRPDFDPDGSLYGEFLLDEVLRGDFEVRAQAKVSLISTAQLTPNEGRKMDNYPPVVGGDRLYINSAYIPIDEVSSRTSPNPPAEDIPGAVPAIPEAQPVGATVQPGRIPTGPARKMLGRQVAAKVAYRAGQCLSLNDVDVTVLTAGLNGDAPTVLALLEESKAADDAVSTFCALIWALAGGT